MSLRRNSLAIRLHCFNWTKFANSEAYHLTVAGSGTLRHDKKKDLFLTVDLITNRNSLTSRMKVPQNSATASLIKGDRRNRLAMEKTCLHCGEK